MTTLVSVRQGEIYGEFSRNEIKLIHKRANQLPKEKLKWHSNPIEDEVTLIPQVDITPHKPGSERKKVEHSEGNIRTVVEIPMKMTMTMKVAKVDQTDHQVDTMMMRSDLVVKRVDREAVNVLQKCKTEMSTDNLRVRKAVNGLDLGRVEVAALTTTKVMKEVVIRLQIAVDAAVAEMKTTTDTKGALAADTARLYRKIEMNTDNLLEMTRVMTAMTIKEAIEVFLLHEDVGVKATEAMTMKAAVDPRIVKAT